MSGTLGNGHDKRNWYPYEPKSQINAMIQSIADQYDLPGDWLNDSLKGFKDENVEIENFMQFKNLKDSTVTAEIY